MAVTVREKLHQARHGIRSGDDYPCGDVDSMVETHREEYTPLLNVELTCQQHLARPRNPPFMKARRPMICCWYDFERLSGMADLYGHKYINWHAMDFWQDMAENLPPPIDGLDVFGGLNDVETFKYLAENPTVILQDLNYIGDGRSTLEPTLNATLAGFFKTDSEQYLGSPLALPKPKSWPFKESSQFSLLFEKARSTFRDNIYSGDISGLPQTYSSPASESDTDAPFVGDSSSPVEPTTPEPLAATVGTDAAENVALPDTWTGTQATTQDYPTVPSGSLLLANEAEADASAFIGESQPPAEPESATTPALVGAAATATAVTDSAVDHEHGQNPAAIGEQTLLPVSSAVTGLPDGISPLHSLAVYPPPPDYKNMGLPVCTPVPPVLLHPTVPPPDYKAVATMNFPVWFCPSLPHYTMPYNGGHYQPSATATDIVANAATNDSQGGPPPSVTQHASESAVARLGNTTKGRHRPRRPAVPAARGRSRRQVNQPNPYPPSGYVPVDDASTTARPAKTVGNPYPSSSGYVEEGHSLAPPVAPVKAKAPRRRARMPSRATQEPRRAAHSSASSSASSSQDGDQVDDDYEGSTTVGKKRKASSKGKEPERAVQHKYPHPKVRGGFTLITKTPKMFIEKDKGIVEEVAAPAGPYQIRFL
ncbi:hypothetical protein PLEOSDRAFT_1081245 [Pleurotus ostreatus PC15]|uniref:Uncharacterized protein n=1 Tax=Pleurotus ostreatus (strain PC15) TaxID=1137138 RepID=A0A067P612_PLEO1|nr:hypothetical protein PLEOSDRAFT_1081245 [Pleurotus ostreatus PC15]